MAANETVDKIREEIKTTVVSHVKDDDGNVVEAKEAEAKEEVKEEAKEEVKEEEKEVEAEGETEEEVEVKEEDDQIKRIKEKAENKIKKEVAKRKELERELAATKKKLETDGKEGVLTEEDVERRSEEKANAKTIERQFVNACNKLFEEAVKVDKTFKTKVDAMAEDVGPIPSVMIGVLEDLDNGGAVLNFLTDNTDDAERIYTLSPAKMAVELTKISTKINKPKIKEISKAADPAKPLGGRASAENNRMPDPKNTEAYIEWRNKDIASKRANGKFNLR